jgi:hypothetical protein
LQFFQGKDAAICQVIILQNVNLTWVSNLTFLRINDKVGVPFL